MSSNTNNLEPLCVLISQPSGPIMVGIPLNPRIELNINAGNPLLHNMSLIPDRYLVTLCQRYKYNKTLIKRAIMKGEWC